MKFDPVKVVHVYYKPEDKKIFVGRLALKSRKIYFNMVTVTKRTGFSKLN